MTAEKSKHVELGLTDSEFNQICEKMGREPNDLELAVFSLMWSEHCAYKHSKKLLGKLPTESDRVVMGPGENAGAVSVGDGEVIAFKVESHNHPSAVEPFQGAATGVGGILRDIFAIGAKPIAILDSLRFGSLDSERSKYLFDQVVAGIGHYGNSHGTPTVGGEIYFEDPYEQNCLVNAMCVGLTSEDQLIRSAAAGPDNLIVLLGASTGRDGIGGASVLASAELDDDDDKRPTVQVGDPFEEKKVMMCCLELLEKDLLVSLQDLGAAGLSSSLSEMLSKGDIGAAIDVSKVPLREQDMEPFEIMISESQERMLCIVKPDHLDAVLEVCDRWQTRSTAIGKLTDGNNMTVYDGDEVVGDMPVAALVDDCPLYDLKPKQPSDPLEHFPKPKAKLSTDLSEQETLLKLLSSENIAARDFAFKQYDSIVQSRTVKRPGQADAAVLKLSESGKAIAVSIDGNGRRVACDPYRGTIEAVLECAQNLACVGAEPIGLTNCLNFGNPEKPHIAWQLQRSVEGMAAACVALDVAVVGGNVSLYNEGPQGPIYPTPVVGMVGEILNYENSCGLGFVSEGDWVALVGPFQPSLKGSELSKQQGKLEAGIADLDLSKHRRALELVREAVREGVVSSAHDISDGGLAVTACESAITGGVGCTLDLEPLMKRQEVDIETALFGEGAGGILITGERQKLLKLSDDAASVGFLALGKVEKNQIQITADSARISLSLEDAGRVYHDTVADLIR